MKYFAKYLPTEGGIKEHDLVFTKFGFGTVVFIYGDNKAYEVEYHDTTKFVKGEPKLAKLFLCSRDIQVGDIIHFEGKEFLVENERDAEFARKSRFKVLGKISSDATWVKQNDEFEEQDIQYWSNNGYEEFKINTDTIDWKDWILYIKIKGPCGHFH